MSKGHITITKNGAVGGGLTESETELNPNGYWITGTTSYYRVVVEKGVKTDLTLDNVSITCDVYDCITVSHAYVTITLIGSNFLDCKDKRIDGKTEGCAIGKDGMDGELTIRCQKADEEGHRCDSSCGSLNAKGHNLDITAIGSTCRGLYSGAEEVGFANFTIEGGNIEAKGGEHSCGIGAACVSQKQSGGKGYAKNITISGGNVKAIGTTSGAGIGGGYGTKVEGLYITGGKVEAEGGAYAPGIGSSSNGGASEQTMEVKDLIISGGDTIVIAVGDQSTNMPGIGSAGGPSYVTDAVAVPDFGYQGYIQDGTSLTNYSFVEGTPFKEKKEINVGKFYTKVYFGPFRDANGIEDSTKEQIGANHIISQTGGDPFTEEQLKGLSMVTGKQENGSDFPASDLTYVDKTQLDAVNKAKTAGKTGEFPVTFTTPNGTTATITVFLKDKGTDAADIHPEQMEPTIAADDYGTDSGGDAWTEEDVQKLCDVKGKNENGATYDQKDLKPDPEQLSAINEVKTAGRGGKFELTFDSPAGKKATVEVILKAYDEITEENDEIIKGLNIISQTGGDAFTEKQLKEFSGVVAWDDTSASISRGDLLLPDAAQIQAINQAKTAGKTGKYPLTISTPNGTQITIHVYLRDNGSSHKEGEEASSIGANGFTKPTGGNLFTEDEIKELCKPLGKDLYGNNEVPSVDAGQLKKINDAKDNYRTGEFPMTFTLKDGTKTVVTVTLTGVHKVTFDPDGGDYQPEYQMVNGGEKAKQPSEPKKDGYTFGGWYYIDENGKEVKWEFEQPVNGSMRLTAKWDPVPKEPSSEERKTTERPKTEQGKQTPQKWKYKEVKEEKRLRVARTGDENGRMWFLLCLAGSSGMILGHLIRKRKIK
ncbi:InlB B-repeat-containing protein [Anaerostipes caccae]|uniref:InlB B-repeat-containing protein n=1 Tax=Anaerostipes caccae TaxID=105841 RepID=UPI00241F5DC2|nr:InlB B-repeat-containing protein [Anaerostipes caccae]